MSKPRQPDRSRRKKSDRPRSSKPHREGSGDEKRGGGGKSGDSSSSESSGRGRASSQPAERPFRTWRADDEPTAGRKRQPEAPKDSTRSKQREPSKSRGRGAKNPAGQRLGQRSDGQRKEKHRAQPQPGKGRYLAPCPHGLEAALAEELAELGARRPEVVKGGVLFDASPPTARRMVLWSRIAVRILEPVSVGEVTSYDDLYEWAKLAPWEELIGKQRTFAVQTRLTGSELTDTRFAALRVKDAIVDRIRDRLGSRPNVDRESPAVPVRLIVRGTRALLFRDLAGESLHRRGYRPVLVKSPLAEGVAAGLLRMTGWTGDSPLIDPMCGSGTFVIEAAMMAAGRAPAIGRKLAAERFPDSDARFWSRLREEAREAVKPSLGVPILGADRHSGALQIARGAAKKANLDHLVEFRAGDALHYEPPFTPSLVVTNPPWGERLGEGDDLVASWRALGTFLRRCPGASAYVLCGAAELTRNLGLKAESRAPIRIGPHDVRWLHYEIHARRDAAEVEDSGRSGE